MYSDNFINFKVLFKKLGTVIIIVFCFFPKVYCQKRFKFFCYPQVHTNFFYLLNKDSLYVVQILKAKIIICFRYSVSIVFEQSQYVSNLKNFHATFDTLFKFALSFSIIKFVMNCFCQFYRKFINVNSV